MDVESVESRFSDMSLSPFGGHGNYAHSDGQMSGSPYKANGNPSYAMLGSRDSWGAQRGYERPLSSHTRPSECLIYYLPRLSCVGIHPIAVAGFMQPSVGTPEPSRSPLAATGGEVSVYMHWSSVHAPSQQSPSKQLPLGILLEAPACQACIWHMPAADSLEYAQ